MTDYISRQAAIEEACKGCNIEFSDEPCEPSECKIRERLINIQAADVRENVESEWELTDHAYTVHCKRCGYKHNRTSQYCPECGAYMTNGTKWFGADMRGEA